jgi:hypothetical protein
LAGIGLAILSWKYVETPIRRRRIFPKRRQMVGLAGVSLAMMLTAGGLAVFFKGFPARCPAAIGFYLDSRNHIAFHNNVSLEQARAGQFVEFGSLNVQQPASVLVWGDSHAMASTPVLDELCRRYGWRGLQATHSATAPLLGYVSRASTLRENSPDFASAVLAYVSKNHVQNVVLAAYWADYSASDAFKTDLVSTVRAFLASGTRVFVLKDVPIPGFDVPRMTAFTVMQHGDLDRLGVTPEQYQLSNQELSRTFDEITRLGATVLDPSKYFLNRNGIYCVVLNGQVLYRDSDHLTVEGSRLLAPLFEPMFRTE